MNRFYDRFYEYLKNKYFFGKFDFVVYPRTLTFRKLGLEITLYIYGNTAKVEFIKHSFLSLRPLRGGVFLINIQNGEYTIEDSSTCEYKKHVEMIEDIRYFGNNALDFVMGLK